MMLYAFAILSILCLIDLLLMKVMAKYYSSIGIPIYKGIVEIKQNKSLRDVGTYVGISEGLVYKIRGNTLLFRTKFNYSNLFRIKFLSIIKGEIKIKDGKACIVQRINLTTLYFVLFTIYIFITNKIDMFGYIFLGIILLFTIVSHLNRISQIEEIRKDIEDNINQERKLKSRWGD